MLSTLSAALLAGCEPGTGGKHAAPSKEAAPPALSDAEEVVAPVIAHDVRVPDRNERMMAGD
jgi:hypothetical protein